MGALPENETKPVAANIMEAVETTDLKGIAKIDIDDVIDYVHQGLERLPDPMSLYSLYLKQRWNVDELDFSQDRRDWNERISDAEKQSFLAIASGFHHGERQVEVDLVPFMLGGTEEEKVFITSQLEDEARHTVFFDRFYKQVVGLEGETIMDVLDGSWQHVSETFSGAFGLLAYLGDALKRDPEDPSLRVRFATNYMLWIEGVLALSVQKITLGYCRQRDILPAYYTGFNATTRDESRHVQFGLKFLHTAVHEDPRLVKDVHDVLRTLLRMNGAVSRTVTYEPLGWDREGVRALFASQLKRKVHAIGVELSPDLQAMVAKMEPEMAGG
jgi:ribonucleoside-diphosphate reductase beta chain